MHKNTNVSRFKHLHFEIYATYYKVTATFVLLLKLSKVMGSNPFVAKFFFTLILQLLELRYCSKNHVLYSFIDWLGAKIYCRITPERNLHVGH